MELFVFSGLVRSLWIIILVTNSSPAILPNILLLRSPSRMVSGEPVILHLEAHIAPSHTPSLRQAFLPSQGTSSTVYF